ncbi:dTDP-4-dehydrorhamnose 3,5-epimerase [Polaribacter sp. Hel1_33_78]|uniref:dTDP-4-dehydrorhamnose 3,5-epimerase n=1 Tax=Polaribacter sp. Hel1_33_78 TaxID=1336804 RepID=UPI00087D345C|nr:dTDP-4-dehydrorhamnose 3,5-epimerase [Polaribacter sp. Hel1_33_78]SDU24297.1 dTDP-4-dehydrorhamnose 3,5-epimerase [Polaribacter sp. Hel1_33_78]
MVIRETNLEGCFIIEPAIFNYGRESFFESFNQKIFEEKTGLKVNFIQDNQSISQRGALQGLHLQKGEFAQAKLVRVIKGRVLDVAVDIRPGSKTYGEHVSIILSEKNKKQLFVPRGFAHGYSVLEDNTVFSYKCDNYYCPNHEGGIVFNDEDLNIDWVLNKEEVLLSLKDNKLMPFKELT